MRYKLLIFKKRKRKSHYFPLTLIKRIRKTFGKSAMPGKTAVKILKLKSGQFLWSFFDLAN